MSKLLFLVCSLMLLLRANAGVLHGIDEEKLKLIPYSVDDLNGIPDIVAILREIEAAAEEGSPERGIISSLINVAALLGKLGVKVVSNPLIPEIIGDVIGAIAKRDVDNKSGKRPVKFGMPARSGIPSGYSGIHKRSLVNG